MNYLELNFKLKTTSASQPSPDFPVNMGRECVAPQPDWPACLLYIPSYAFPVYTGQHSKDCQMATDLQK